MPAEIGTHLVTARFGNPEARTVAGYEKTGGYAQLRYELGPFGLDSEFHFPLMWSLRGAVASGTGSM